MTRSALLALLEESKVALLAGDPDGATRHASRIAEHLQSMAKLDREDMHHLHALSAEISLLLQAALRGIQSVRMGFASAEDHGFSTYDEDGQRRSVPQADRGSDLRF